MTRPAAGYPQVSGAGQVRRPITATSNLRIRYKILYRILSLLTLQPYLFILNKISLEPYTVERILLTYLCTLLTYRKLPFTDKLRTLGKNKGHFIVLKMNSVKIKWPYFLP